MSVNDNDPKPSKKSRALKELKAALSGGDAPPPAPKTKPSTPRRRTKPAGDVSINGDGNTVIGGDNIVHFATPPIVQNITHVQTGVGVLTAAQKAKINAIIKEWAESRGAVRRSKTEISGLRWAFNQYMKVNKYDEILQEDFEKAVKWLRRQTGIIKRMPSARKKMPNWRNQQYRAIFARAKPFPDGEARFRRYAEERFGTSSLGELDDDQLQAVYDYVFGW